MSVLACIPFLSISQSGNFITKWQDYQQTLVVDIAINPDANLSYDYTVAWGDGTTDHNVNTSISHTYPSTGAYGVTISGDFPAIFMKESSTQENLVDILEWGSNIDWETMAFAFAGCENLGSLYATDDPDLSNVEDMSYMFHNCTNMEVDASGWDVSTIVNMRGTFSGAASFNSEIGSWETTALEDATSMFENATSFNQDLEWETTNLSEMSYIFSGATAFNGAVNSLYVAEVRDFDGVFQNAESFNQPLDEWDVSGATSMESMFSGALIFDRDISSWDVESVSDMAHMFEGAVAFDQDLGGWSISSVGDMRYMLSASNLSACNYEATLDGWTSSAPSDITLGADGLDYFDETGRDDLLSSGWTIKGDIENRRDDCGLSSEVCGVGHSTFFILEFDLSEPGKTTAANRTIEIPCNNQTYNYDIDWDNDGIFDETGATGTETHTYPGTRDVWEVAIRANETNGNFPTIVFWNSEHAPKVTSIVQWGCNDWETFNRSFESCSNMGYRATDAPDLSASTNFSMSNMFKQASVFTGNLNNWDVSGVTSMNGMFEGASDFNGDISDWEVTNLESIGRMFLNASSFEGDLSEWDITGNVTSLNSTFMGASEFDSDIGDWDVSEVTTMHHAFHNATSFNQDLSDWDVSSVETMYGAFYGASSFDNDGVALTWGTNTGSVETMTHMFRATPFNQAIGGWDVSSVTNMSHMFAVNDDFDQDIDNWDVSSVTDFTRMFYLADAFDQDLDWDINQNTSTPVTMMGMFESADNFNGDISTWDVDNVENMRLMFSGASQFNRSIGGWDVSAVENMEKMFSYATNFDQSLGGWDIHSVLPATGSPATGSLADMLDNCGMSRSNYEATLQGWAQDANTPDDLTLGAATLEYCDATYRNILISTTVTANVPDNWTINDDSQDCSLRPANTGSGSSGEGTQIQGGETSNSLLVSPPRFRSRNASVLGVKLYTLNGQLIYQREGADLNIPTQGFSTGVYLLNIETTEGVKSQKVSIVR